MKSTRKYRGLLFLPGVVIAVSLLSAGVMEQQKPEWVAPAAADTIKNPLKGNNESAAAGKKVYTTYCVPCHGDKGRGDGLAAGGLNPKPANHTSEKFQK